LAGSCVVEDDEPLGLGLLGGVELLAPPLGELGLLLLEELGLLGLLAPPEAEPDFALSLDEDGLDELDEAPPDGDEGELLGEDVLELEEPGPDEALLGLSPRSHAARPRASATATAIAESFMCPPWVGVLQMAANCAPDLNP
jgi:hypothetical protein